MEKRLLQFVRELPWAAAILDADMRYLCVSDVWRTEHGLAAGELRGVSYYDLFPNLPEHLRSLHRRALAGEVISSECESIIDREGRERFMRWEVRPWHLDGAIAGITLFSQDVSATVRASRELDEARDRFAVAFRSSPLAMCITRASDASFLDVNDAFCSMFRHSRETLQYFHTAHFSLWQDPDERARFRSRLHADGRVLDYRMQFRAGHDTGWADISAEIIVLRGERCIMAILHDVTDQIALQAQLSEAARMDDVRSLAPALAHDFNEHLSVILGAANICCNADMAPHDKHRYLQTAVNAIQQASSLTRQLALFANDVTDTRATVEINEALDIVSALIQRLLPANLQIKLAPAGLDLFVHARPADVHQLLVNLLLHARDNMPTGGEISLQTQLIWYSTPARLITQANSRYIVVQMRERPLAPVSAYTPSSAEEPQARALANVKRIAEEVEGWVEAGTKSGSSRTLSVYLPAAPYVQSDDEASPARATSVEAFKPRPASILLVEDYPALREVTTEILTRHGYEVNPAGSPQEALELMQQEGFHCDLVITDVLMPGMSGPELLQKLRELRPDLPALFLSGYDRAQMKEATQPDAIFLRKPVGTTALIAQIESTLARTRPSTAN